MEHLSILIVQFLCLMLLIFTLIHNRLQPKPTSIATIITTFAFALSRLFHHLINVLLYTQFVTTWYREKTSGFIAFHEAERHFL